MAVIRAAALRHGADAEQLVRVGWCESRHRMEARGKAGEIGLMQFMPQTFPWLSKISGLGYPSEAIHDLEAQADVAAWAFAHGWGHLWTCQ